MMVPNSSTSGFRSCLQISFTMLIMALLMHSSKSLSTLPNRPKGCIPTIAKSRSSNLRRMPCCTQLRMRDEQFYDYNYYSSNEEPSNQDAYYYTRGQSQLARLAQQSQQSQQPPYSNDIQSMLNQELDMMEQKLLQFQEDSSRRSQELLDKLEVFSRQKRYKRGGNVPNVAASITTEGPFLGNFVNDVESE